jgi:hypothetical protein
LGVNDDLACFVASSYYIYSPYSFAILRNGVQPFYFSYYALSPVYLGVFIYFIEHDAVWPLPILGILSVMMNSGIQNFLLSNILLLTYLLYHLLFSKGRKKYVRKGVLWLLVVLISNLWWILPLFSSFYQPYSEMVPNYDFRKLFVETSKWSGWSYVLRNIISSWFAFYNTNPLGITSTAIVPMFTFLSLMFLDRYKDKNYLFFVFLTIFSISMMLGNQSPFGFFYRLLIENPLFAVFLPFDPGKWSLFYSISLAVLVGFSLNNIKSKKFYKNMVTYKVICLAFIVIVALPSSLVASSELYSFLEPVKVPRYYQEAHDWLSSQEDLFRIFVIPSPYFQTYTKYSWSPHVSADVALRALPKPLIYNVPPNILPGSDIYNTIVKKLLSNESDVSDILKVIGVLNARYILIRQDLDSSYSFPSLHTERLELIKNRFLSLKNIKVYTFNNLIFLENPEYIPFIYAAKVVFLVYGNESVLFSLASVPWIHFNESAFFFVENLSKSDLAFVLPHADFVFVSSLSSIIGHDSLQDIISRYSIYPIYEVPFTSNYYFTPEGNYYIYISKEVSESRNQISLKIDNSTLYFDKYILGPIYFKNGYHLLNLTGFYNSRARVFLLPQKLFDLNFRSLVSQLSLKIVDLNEFKVYVKNEDNIKPKFIIIGTQGDGWVAEDQGEYLRKIPVNKIATAFFIDSNHEMLRIYYFPTSLMKIGLFLSLISFILICYLVIMNKFRCFKKGSHS